MVAMVVGVVMVAAVLVVFPVEFSTQVQHQLSVPIITSLEMVVQVVPALEIVDPQESLSVLTVFRTNLAFRLKFPTLFFEIYFSTLRNLAFIATITVLNDMRMAPIAGLSRMPTLNKTPAANGIANAL